jgi:pimeloyl-ACP methyl ester carboxylesterase
MYATINGARLAYSERGIRHGRSLLLIHGHPLNRHLWDAQLAGLAGVAHVIAPDLRGSGDSEVTPGPYSMDLFADDLAALLDHLKIGRAIVAGLSMGGYIAFSFWRRHAARVQALALVDTRAEPDTPQARAGRDTSADLVRREGTEALARQMLPRLLAPENFANATLAGRALAIMAVNPGAGMVGNLQAMRDRQDSRPLLAQISVPTLVIAGEADQFTPPSDGQAMADAIPGARMVVIPRAGHLSPLENPRAVNRTLRAFVERVSER